MFSNGHGVPTAGKAANGGLFSQTKPTYRRKIKSIELENKPSQSIEIEHFTGILDIAVQGDGMYMYCKQSKPDTPIYNNKPEEIKLWIVRNDEEYDPHKVRGVYVKTIVVKDVAYHFFCNHQFSQ